MNDEPAFPGSPRADAEAAIPKYVHTGTQCLEHWNRLKFPLRIAPNLTREFNVGFPLAAHALNHAAVGLETRDRFPHAAATSARVALEHALAAQWVLLTRGGAETLIRHMEAGYRARVKAFAGALNDSDPLLTGPVDAEDLAAFASVAAQEPAPGTKRSWSMERVFRRFAGTDLVYDLFRQLSGAVHPSYETIQAHLDTRNEHPPRLNRAGALLSEHSSRRRRSPQCWRWTSSRDAKSTHRPHHPFRRSQSRQHFHTTWRSATGALSSSHSSPWRSAYAPPSR